MAVAKICMVCGEKCADRPRLKDAQGRYACQVCVEAKRGPGQRARARAPGVGAAVAQAPAPAVDAGIGFSMDDYLGDVQAADANPCPTCGTGRAADAVVCMQCGFDSSSGRAMKTKVGKDKPKRARPAPRMSSGMVCVIIALAMLVVLPLVALASPETAALALIVAGLWAFVAYIYMIGAAFRDDDKFWGIIGLLVLVPLLGGLCWLAFVLYYCTIGSQRGVRKLSYWASLVTVWIILGIMYMHNPELFTDAGPGAVP